MRFFLKIKQNGKQIGLKRIQSKSQIQTTNELIALVQNSLNVQYSSFIVRLINDQNKFRIIKDWPLKIYNLRTGMQLEIQLLSNARQSQAHNVKMSEGQKIGQVLFNKLQMEKIIQENQQEGQKSSQISKLVESKYEELLKVIQKNNTQAYMKMVKENQLSLGVCENQFFKKQLLAIQNQLGTKGWAAIHYAAFAGNTEIVDFLIQNGADINIKSSDEWLPIQLAVRQQNIKMVELLTAQPTLNVNICTSHGLVINMAVQSMNREIIKKLFQREVNFSAKDHLGRTIYDALGPNPDKQMMQLLNSLERRQSLSFSNDKAVMYHALISSFRGQVVQVRTPPRKDRPVYLLIDPYQQLVRIYEDRVHYPQYPKQTLTMNIIHKFKLMSKSERSWYMKSDLFYFLIETPRHKNIYGCYFQQTANRWVQSYQQSLQNANKYSDSIKDFKRNDSVILDRIQQQQTTTKKRAMTKLDDLISLFTSKSQQMTQQTAQSRSIPNSPARQEKNQTTFSSNGKGKDKQKEKEEGKQKKKETQKPKLQVQKVQPAGSSEADPNFNKTGLKFSDFKITKVLGEGSFGTVYLALDLRNPQKKRQYALKCFKKKKLVANKQIKYTVAQLNILKQLSHPFIVNLHFTFQTPNYVYLGLDYCPNKDLSHHLMNEVTFPEKQAMIYAAEILSALQYLHQKNIIYRDLKPENIMLDNKGHVRLVDFGLSKQGQDQNFVAKSFCGSPAYLSPQMLIKKGVGKQSDFYCLGAVLYQMLVGQPPFFSDDITTLYNNISTSKLTFPKGVSSQAKSLLIGLLQRKPQNRLGYKGAQQIKMHTFFKNINWINLLKKQIKAPIREEIEVEEQDQNNLHQIIHKDFDYGAQNQRFNRFLNFSFIRQENCVGQ